MGCNVSKKEQPSRDESTADAAAHVRAVIGAFGGTGQKCTASSRLIVTEGVHDVFVTKVKERMEKLQAYLRGAAAAAKRQGVGVGPENFFAAKKRGGAAEAAWAALTRFLMLVDPEALWKAASKGDEAEVSRLIAQGAPLEHRNMVRVPPAEALREAAERARLV